MRQDDDGGNVKMNKYGLEFILESREAAGDSLKRQLSELGERLQVFEPQAADNGPRDLRINIITEDPTAIFDICAQFGRLKTVKVNELKAIP